MCTSQCPARLQDLSAELSIRLIVVRQGGKEEEDSNQPTDSWTSEASTAGQRAIHLSRYHKGWAVVPPTGLQRAVAAASGYLKQNLKQKLEVSNLSITTLSPIIVLICPWESSDFFLGARLSEGRCYKSNQCLDCVV